MSESELLWFIFTDNFISNLFFITNPELAIWSAPKLTNLSLEKILIAGSVGFGAAIIVNYIFGIVISKALASSSENEKARNNQNLLKNIFANFGFYVLAFSFFYIYSKLVVLIAGYIRYSFTRTFIIVMLSKIIFYAISLYSF